MREKIRRQWASFVAFGVALMTLGFVALGAIGFVALASVVVLGWLLVLAGVMQTTHALRVRSWGGLVRLFVAGVLSLAVGVVMLANHAASQRTLALAMILLGGMIAVEWPVSGAWAVGTLVGIALIFDGWSLVMAGVAAHELGQRSSRHLRLVRRTIAD